MFQLNKCCSFSYEGDLSWINFRGDWGNEKDGCYPLLLGTYISEFSLKILFFMYRIK